eukprot:gnl/Chilomastix_caulleri/3592.p4 GENE.gnl/Chilomastix_caulleri/3592~~gnl/Chilomastix_caulleri/3592.p4  ORF type:complete len:71 (-),score=10.42 gnl/Chilomastix_caulleri/3592:696-908(-)
MRGQSPRSSVCRWGLRGLVAMPVSSKAIPNRQYARRNAQQLNSYLTPSTPAPCGATGMDAWGDTMWRGVR